MPEVISNPEELYRTVQKARRSGKRVGLVPTMGALHQGHLSLVERSQSECDETVVTIFVNPTQFGPSEDLGKYPRTLDADLEKLGVCGVHWVFVPKNKDIYPEGYSTYIDVEGVSQPLEGEKRPGHFRGVATVVLKLFNMSGADAAYFGEKDFQQLAVIRRMAKDLNLPIEIHGCPIVREPDGLAMSSRNVYLSPEERRQSLVLFESLNLAKRMIAEGHRDPTVVRDEMCRTIKQAESAEIDYVALVDPETLDDVPQIQVRVLVALAVRIGATRLIDNMLIEVP